MKFIGIDPGIKGGIAMIETSYLPKVHPDDVEVDKVVAYKMPQTTKDVFLLLSDMIDENTYAILEKVASSPQMGVVSAFTFGRGYGVLEACLYASGCKFEYVQPVKWQRVLGCLSKGDKNITKAKAQQLFPYSNVTHLTSDALLIAEYARRSYVSFSSVQSKQLP